MQALQEPYRSPQVQEAQAGHPGSTSAGCEVFVLQLPQFADTLMKSDKHAGQQMYPRQILHACRASGELLRRTTA
jgi:hypothetical protein